MAMTDQTVQLGCGRSMDDIWDHIDVSPDSHQLTCAYCRAARTNLAGLARATRQLRQDEVDDDSLQTSPATIDRILTIARSEVRRGRRLSLVPPGPDQASDLTISEQAVAVDIRRVGDQTGPVQVRRCAVQVVPPDQTPDQESPRSDVGATSPSPGVVSSRARDRVSVQVCLRISVAADAAIPDVVPLLRRSIIGVVDQEVGLDVRKIDVIVEDVHDE